MSAFEDQVRSLMQADRVEVPVDLEFVLDSGREAVRGRRLGWTLAGITVLGLVVSVVTPILIAGMVPAVPAPATSPVPTVAASPASAPDPDGITWRLVRWTGGTGNPNPGGTLLVRGTEASGTTACGTFTAELARAPGSWRMSAFQLRTHSCPLQADRASSRYLEALGAVTAATVGAGELRLHSAGGDLVFARQ